MGELGDTSFRLEVMTPERPVISDEVSELMAPGAEGYFGVLPGHTPFITTLGIGELTYRQGKDERHLAVTWGYAEVRRDRVIVLAETAERAEEIDVERAERARQRAEGHLQAWFGGDEEVDFARAQAALYRALNRVEVARKGQ